MMTMSRAISAGKALDYYRQEFTNSKDNYYSEAGEVKGRWSGGLADEWEPGPIDVAAWGAGALGVGLGLVVAACFALATAAVQGG